MDEFAAIVEGGLIQIYHLSGNYTIEIIKILQFYRTKALYFGEICRNCGHLVIFMCIVSI